MTTNKWDELKLDLYESGITGRLPDDIEEYIKGIRQQYIEKIEKMSSYHLDYVPTNWQDSDEEPEFIVKQDVLNILKDK